MIYSNAVGIDLMNNDVDICTVLSEYISDIFYARKGFFNCIDYGSGVFGIGVGAVLDVLTTVNDIRDFLQIDEDAATEIFDALMSAHNKRAYTV